MSSLHSQAPPVRAGSHTFQFKQFLVKQQGAAMKVTTDACLLGAWFAAKKIPAERVLDIGSGTGLLMLMLAQQAYAVDGIELDPGSFRQAMDNIAASPWFSRLSLFEGDVRTYLFGRTYDFIIANPPFYENDLPSVDPGKNLAMHSSELKLAELLDVVNKIMSPTGSFGMLLHYHRRDYFEQLAESRQLYVVESLSVRQTPTHDFFRSILCLSRDAKPAIRSEITIRDRNGEYTEAFVILLQSYYLYL